MGMLTVGAAAAAVERVMLDFVKTGSVRCHE